MYFSSDVPIELNFKLQKPLPAHIYLYMYDVRKCRSNTTIHNLSNNICGVSVLRKLEDKKINKKCFEDERKSTASQ
jgi:hypothetical protein